ncbi:3833_t:CDS:2, partial [Cetraspora pellucida]
MLSLVEFTCSLNGFGGGTGFQSLYIGSTNKLYYFGPGSQYFSIDLTGVSLDGNSVISSSQWIQFNFTSFRFNTMSFLGVKTNNKIYFPTDSDGFIDTYDTTLNKWDMNISFTGRPSLHFESFRAWTSDESTGKAYSIQETLIDIFDTINLVWTNSSLIPQIDSIYVGSDLNGPPQTLVNSQLLYFGQPSGILGAEIKLMTSILAYNSLTDSWQLINTTGKVPSVRSDHTVVSISDGRIIMYGGITNNTAASPSIVVLNFSNYEWTVPNEINSIGSLTGHTSTIIKNYMITAFGKNMTERDLLKQSSKSIYKLDISDPLNYKWSLLSTFTTPTFSTPTSKIPSSYKGSSADNNTPNNGLFIGIGVLQMM